MLKRWLGALLCGFLLLSTPAYGQWHAARQLHRITEQQSRSCEAAWVNGRRWGHTHEEHMDRCISGLQNKRYGPVVEAIQNNIVLIGSILALLGYIAVTMSALPKLARANRLNNYWIILGAVPLLNLFALKKISDASGAD